MLPILAGTALVLAMSMGGAEEPETYNFTATIACAPETFDAAVHCLRTTLPAGARAELLQPNGPIRAHHGFGTLLRNEWGLWNAEAPLHRSLAADGFIHPDDMSAAIIDAYVAAERGESFDRAAAVSEYRAHWRRSERRTPLPLTECASEHFPATAFQACWRDGNGGVIGELRLPTETLDAD